MNSYPKPTPSTLRKAKRIHAQRPKKAIEVDNAILSHVTKYLPVWQTDPSRWDIWGVDTPKKKRRNY